MTHTVTRCRASSPLCPHRFPPSVIWCTWISPSTSSPFCHHVFSACLCCPLCFSVTTVSQICLLVSASCLPSPTFPSWGTSWSRFPGVWVSWKHYRHWMFHITSFSGYLRKLVLWRSSWSWNCPTISWSSYQRAWVRVYGWVGLSLTVHYSNELESKCYLM